MFTAEYDFYRPDGIEFAQKLKKAGKLLDYGDYGGIDHGFQFIKDAEYEKVTFIKDFTRLIKTYLWTGKRWKPILLKVFKSMKISMKELLYDWIKL